MKVLILGAGALGGYFGGKLQKSGVSVDFLVRAKRAAQLAESGLTVREAGGVFKLPVKAVTVGQFSGTYDVVLLTCKSYDLASAMNDIAPTIGSGTVIVPLLNGVAHIEALSQRFGADKVLGGATLVFASLTANGEVERGAVPIDGTFIGELSGARTPRAEAIVATFNGAGVTTMLSENILAFMWRKFFGFGANAILTTLVHARAGEIAQAPAGAAYVTNVIEELTGICAKEGFPVAPEDPATIGKMFSQAGSLYAPSIFRDMEGGRPTEAEHTIGDLVQRADRLGLPAPLSRAALCRLQIHEQRRLNAAKA